MVRNHPSDLSHAHRQRLRRPSATEPLVPTTIKRRDVGATDVLIAIRYAGICHSDIHTVRGEWGEVAYPLPVGHEIVGEVVEIGTEVSKHALNDRVGVGCMVNSCRECVNCLAGEEQYCLKGNVGTYAALDRDGSITQGGYSTHVVVDEDFVLRVPETIPVRSGRAPALRRHHHHLLAADALEGRSGFPGRGGRNRRTRAPGRQDRPRHGGRGHRALAVVAQAGGRPSAGAKHYYATSDPATFEELRNGFDLIVNTVSAVIDVDAFLGLLALDGTMVNVGAPPEALPIHVFSLFGNRRSFAGSGIGSIRETQEMLDFCAEHEIASDVEVISAEAINEAYERVLSSDVRYRFVIDIETLS